VLGLTSEQRPTSNTVDLSGHLGALHDALELILECPTLEPVRLSLAGVKTLLPTDIVHFCLLLEMVRGMGFPEVQVEAPKPSFLGVYLWRIGLWDLFPEYAPRRPLHEPGRGSNDRCVELTRFNDLAGAFELGERLPHVLTSAPGAAEVVGGLKTLKQLSSAVFEIAENTAAHSCRLRPGAGVMGYYMAQRMPRAGRTFIALGDVGDGIPTTIRVNHAVGTDLEALRLALVPGVSGNDGGGNGLGIARQVTETLPGGAMTIESGGALLRVRASGQTKDVEYARSLPATRVSFFLKV
jgi:hypothetical protein